MRHVISVLAILLLGGCASLRPISPHKIGEGLNAPPLEVGSDWAGRFQSAQTPEDRGFVAREFAFAKLAESDRRCENYLVGLSAGDNSLGAALDLASLGATLLGSGATSLANANDLARGAGFIQGLRKTATDNLFAGQEFALIYDNTHIGRNAERKLIVKSIEDGKFNTWGPNAILGVITPYDLKCGINYAALIIRQNMADNPPTPTGVLPTGAGPNNAGPGGQVTPPPPAPPPPVVAPPRI